MSIENTIEFEDMFTALQTDIHKNAVEHGWWEDARNDGELIALMHSELSEALEGMRHGNPPDSHCPEYSSVEVELADCVIRILDYVEARNLNLIGAMIAKHEYNKSRPYKHGKQF